MNLQRRRSSHEIGWSFAFHSDISYKPFVLLSTPRNRSTSNATLFSFIKARSQLAISKSRERRSSSYRQKLFERWTKESQRFYMKFNFGWKDLITRFVAKVILVSEIPFHFISERRAMVIQLAIGERSNLLTCALLSTGRAGVSNQRDPATISGIAYRDHGGAAGPDQRPDNGTVRRLFREKLLLPLCPLWEKVLPRMQGRSHGHPQAWNYAHQFPGRTIPVWSRPWKYRSNTLHLASATTKTVNCCSLAAKFPFPKINASKSIEVIDFRSERKISATEYSRISRLVIQVFR